MGYYAHGYGVVKTKESVVGKEFEKAIWKLNDDLGLSIDDVSLFKEEYHVTVGNEKYHDEDWKETLKAISKLISEGEFEFTGEDEESWKFKFYPEEGVWKEMMGEIVYNEETATEI